MANLKAANVTKYDAGGSGDNYIADGYIKSVEKVWIDSYSLQTHLNSNDSIMIGRVPKNKKITDIVVELPALDTAGSTCSVTIGSGSGLLATASVTYLGNLIPDGGNALRTTLATFNMGSAVTLRLSGDKQGTVTSKDTEIWIKVLPTVGTSTHATTGQTIRTIIKYT